MRASGVLLVLALTACQPEPLAPEASVSPEAPTEAHTEWDIGPALSASFAGDTLTTAQRITLWNEARPLVERLLAEDTVSVQIGSLESYGDFTTYTLTATGGHVFSPGSVHLLLRVHQPDGGPHDADEYGARGIALGGVLRITSDSLEWMLTSQAHLNSWTGDSLRDANGDSYTDLVISNYPSSGCCPREGDDVFLYDSASGGFAPPIFFINAVYLPDLGLVRGMEYGHWGGAAFYTKRFAGLNAEEVECVYRTPEADSPYAIGGCDPDAERRGIAEVPATYDVLDRYRGWFEGGG